MLQTYSQYNSHKDGSLKIDPTQTFNGYKNKATFDLIVLLFANSHIKDHASLHKPFSFNSVETKRLLESYSEITEQFTFADWMYINWAQVSEVINEFTVAKDKPDYNPKRVTYRQLLRLFEWHGGQSSPMYRLASSAMCYFKYTSKVNKAYWQINDRSSAQMKEFWITVQPLLVECISELKALPDHVVRLPSTRVDRDQIISFLTDKLIHKG